MDKMDNVSIIETPIENKKQDGCQKPVRNAILTEKGIQNGRRQ